jgi:valyl-tRNA synthetase
VWDVDFRTAVAQAEIEDRDTPGALHRIMFERVDGSEPVAIETTRPELLVSCVALVAHPDDERYKPLFGSAVDTPVFGVSVPVLAHRLADPEKGTGIAMICTFGDTSDIVWWRELGLPLRVVIQRNGRFQRELPGWLDEDTAAIWEDLAQRTVRQVRTRMVALLRESGALIGEPRAITHPVNHYEKGDRPLEIVTSRQWYIRNGAHDPALAEALMERGLAVRARRQLGAGRSRERDRSARPRHAARLAAVVDEATTSFDAYEHHGALSTSERFFWQFCDSYIELVKGRADGDGDGAASAAAAASSIGLSTILRLFAPSCRSSRRRCGRGGRRARSIEPHGRSPRSSASTRATETRRSSTPRRTCSPSSTGPRRPRDARCAPTSNGW